jgi:hypothetical protein
MTVALNIILMAVVFSAVVGTLAWTILSARPVRHSRPARSASRQPAFQLGPANRRSADAL